MPESKKIKACGSRLIVVAKPRTITFRPGISKDEISAAARICEELIVVLQQEIESASDVERIGFAACLAHVSMLAGILALIAYVISQILLAN